MVVTAAYGKNIYINKRERWSGILKMKTSWKILRVLSIVILTLRYLMVFMSYPLLDIYGFNEYLDKYIGNTSIFSCLALRTP